MILDLGLLSQKISSLKSFALLLGVVCVFFAHDASAQNAVPQGINYQAIARNANGGVYVNQNIAVRISILEGTAPGELRYQERHVATTNVFGLFTLKIGAGTPLIGSFSAINWSTANHYLKVEVDNTGGSNYTDLGENELLSVPYAFYAQTSGSGGSGSSGINCWDTDSDGVQDDNEDINNDGIWDALDCRGAQGPIGLTGPQGNVGPQGQTGAQGPQGATGPQGPVGLTGPQGPPGPGGGLNCWDLNGNGSEDAAEDINNDGIWDALDCRGADGIAGPQGNTGPQGPVGATGAQGTIGLTGPQGPAGATGPQGPVGLTGPQGPPGPGGGLNCWDLNGNGSEDAAEDINNDGIWDALDCRGADGIAGPQGLTGAQGPAGNQGPQGNTGPQGPVGATGAQGPIGLTGPQGPTGAQGPIGPTGLTGPQGPQGNAGPQGPSGSTGAQGPAGAIGAVGPQGPAGNDGLDCWDLDGDGVQDALEDKNNDGLWNALDCQGAPGSAGNAWQLNGNSFSGSEVEFLGTTDNSPLNIKVNNQKSGRIDVSGNTILGYRASNNGTSINSFTTALGFNALFNQGTGNQNTAIGYKSMSGNAANFSANKNTALGHQSLFSISSGTNNVGLGYESMYSISTGEFNTSVGSQSLRNIFSGNQNTAMGYLALINTITSSNNTGIGYGALQASTTDNNTAVGSNALSSNSGGGSNTALGATAGSLNAVGSANTFVGYASNILNTSLNVSNSTAIGNAAIIDASNKIVLGNTSITSIQGQVAFTTFSDARIKDNIEENIPGLAFIRLLRPVSYNYNIRKQDNLLGLNSSLDWKEKYDVEHIRFSGFIAQEVEASAQKVGYNFSGIDKSGTLIGLRYSEFVVPIVKSVQELDNENKNLQSQIELLRKENLQLKSDFELLQKRLDALEKR
ncbi:MAG: tail fiber domain-containing protein [Bacteroidia bacterium]